MRFVLVGVLGLLAIAGGAPARAGAPTAITIGFADVGTGFYAGTLTTPDASFVSSTGNLYIGAAGGDSAVCAFAPANCAGTLTVTFIGAVSNLSFLINGDNTAGSSLFVNGTDANGSFSFTGGGFDADVHTSHLIDLSYHVGITSLTLSSNDERGLGYDQFTFAYTQVEGPGTPVPEPTAWAMMLTGLGVVGSAIRRRNRSTVAA